MPRPNRDPGPSPLTLTPNPHPRPLALAPNPTPHPNQVTDVLRLEAAIEAARGAGITSEVLGQPPNPKPS